jgi:hypothetical protein
MDGALKSTVTIPVSATLPAPKTYTFKYKSIVTAGNHTFKAIAYENSVPASSTTTSTLTVAVTDAAPNISELICTPNAVSYVANPTVGISVSAKVNDDAKVTKVEFYWVPNPTLPNTEPGTLKNTININALSGTATYLYTGISISGELRVLAYDELGNLPTEFRKAIIVAPNAAPDCSPVFVEGGNTFTSPIVKNGTTVLAAPATVFNPGTITFQVAAKDETGTVTKMELFNNNVLFATSTTPTAMPDPNFLKPPYYFFTFTFPALATGTYNLTWKATDTYGAFCTQLVPFELNVTKCADPNEPGDNLKTGATSLGLSAIKYAKIGSATDVDFYKIVMTPTTVIELNGTDATGGKANLPADFDMALYGPGVKSTLPIAVSENDGVTPEVIDALVDLPAAGINAPDGVKTFILKVYGYNGATSTSCYRLSAGDPIAPRARTSRTKSTKNTAVEGADTGMLLIPNPASNEVSLITTTETAGEYNVAITDILGREVKRQTLTLNEGDNVSTLDISTVNKGMYLVRLWNDKKQMIQKLSVEK